MIFQNIPLKCRSTCAKGFFFLNYTFSYLFRKLIPLHMKNYIGFLNSVFIYLPAFFSGDLIHVRSFILQYVSDLMLAYNVREGCWWYGSKGWILLPITHVFCFGLITDSNLAKWCLTWNRVGNTDMSLNISMQKKWQLPTLIFISSCWM